MMLKSPLITFLLRKIVVGILIVFLATWMVSALMHSASYRQSDTPQMSYFQWLGELFTFGFASRELFVRTLRTLTLTFGSLLVSLLFSLPLGIFSALRKDSKSLKFLTGLTDLVCSTPVFVTAYVFILLGMKIFHHNFAAVGGERSSFALVIMFFALGLGNGTVSEITRHTREETIRVLEQNYFKAAVARGVNLTRHFVKSLLIPFLNVVSSRVVYLVSGAVVVESAFNWKGIGKWSWDSALNGNYPVVMSITFIMIVFVLLIRLGNGLVATYVDSRRR
jgi:peptide/nickel transport system permease protein